MSGPAKKDLASFEDIKILQYWIITGAGEGLDLSNNAQLLPALGLRAQDLHDAGAPLHVMR